MDVLEFLARLTQNTADDQAVAIVRTVHAAVISALNGLVGHLSPEDVLDQLTRLTEDLKHNDLATDTELDRKFRDPG